MSILGGFFFRFWKREILKLLALIAGLFAASVDQVLDFPGPVNSDNLETVHPAMTEISVVIKLIRGPNH